MFGSALQRAQQAALANLPPGAPHVLIVGGGTGWVLGEVLSQRPAAHILYLEASAVMLRKSRERLQGQAPAHAAQVEFRLGTEADLPPSAQFDALHHLFPARSFTRCLVCGGLLQRLQAVSRPGATWLVADFCPPDVVATWAAGGDVSDFSALRPISRPGDCPPWPEELARLGLSRAMAEAVFWGYGGSGIV